MHMLIQAGKRIFEWYTLLCYLLSDDKIKEVQNSPSKFATLKSAAAASPTPEAIVEERKNYGKSEADDDDSDEESDASGEDEYDDDEVCKTVTLLKLAACWFLFRLKPWHGFGLR
jgi:ribosomal protein L12E/L44/L45/RPP1/RPP2